MKRIVGLTLLLLLLLPPTTPAGAAGGVLLAGETTISGAQPGSLLVTLPVAASISDAVTENPDVTVEGAGRYIGVVLVAEGNEERIGSTLIAGQVDPDAICDDQGCPFGVATLVAGAGLGSGGPGRWLLPAGDYRLHLVAEESAGPVSVTLRLGGLEGTTHLVPSDPTGLETVPMPPRVPLPESQSVYWNSARHDMGVQTRGMIWTVAWLRHPLEPAGKYHYCIYRDAEPEDHPGCVDPVLDLGFNNTLVGYPAKAWVLLEGFGFPVQGDFAQKLWFAGNLVDGVDGLALWLPFGDVETPLPGVSAMLRATVFPARVVEPAPAPRRMTTTAGEPLWGVHD
jgi:hypothetical protein